MRPALLLCILSFGLYSFSQAAPTNPTRAGKQTNSAKTTVARNLSTEGKACLQCHEQITPGLVEQWDNSVHAIKGVDCFSCHKGSEKDPATFDHYGYRIAVIVTPKYCARCHTQEFEQFEKSHHAQATQFIGSLDNTLGEIVEGGPAAVNGCRQCHGSEVKYTGDGKFDPNTWPNGGIGRLNPDGSRGSCAACHGRHSFSAALARQPENCGKCHLGPDHPQAEIYNESKHGIQFRANLDGMNLNSKSWVVGKDYSAAPTCATCHMSATSTQKVTHDVGDRLSYTLRPAISVHMENWQKRRGAMQDVCSSCHAAGCIDNFYKQYDATVELYNDKFGEPAKAIMDRLRADKKITPTPFDEHIEWIYYELWHHQGRRARMGTAMMGPDYTQWHGFYEVAKSFYTEFVPEAERLEPGITAAVMNTDYHKWHEGMTPEQIQQQIEFYKKRYNQ
jgi:hypothetical protein